MRMYEIISEANSSRRGFLGKALGGIAGVAGALGLGHKIADTINGTSNYTFTPRATASQVRQADNEIVANIMGTLRNPLERTLASVAMKNGIFGLELAQLLAQASHETANFSTLVEKGTPVYFLKKYWGARAAPLLGNKTQQDAINFIGRGFIQLTGRDSYEWASNVLQMPQLLIKPWLAQEPEIASKIFIEYWKKNIQNRLRSMGRDYDDTATISALINRPSVAKLVGQANAAPKIHGLDDRHRRFVKYAELFGISHEIDKEHHDKVKQIGSAQSARNNKGRTANKPTDKVSKNVRSGRRM
jgi:predicted chitinase